MGAAGAFAVLNMVLVAPSAVVRPDWLPSLAGESVLLVTLVVWSGRRVAAWCAAAVWGLLLALQVAAALGGMGGVVALAGLAGVAGTVFAAPSLRASAWAVRRGGASGRRVLGLGWVLAAVGLVIPGDLPAQWVGPGAVAELWRSAGERRVVDELVATHAELLEVEARRTPHVLIYVVEAYGRVAFQDIALRADMLEEVKEFQRTAAAEGWHTASGFAAAPPVGDAPWPDDATALLGFEVAAASTWRHVVARSDRIAHLPGLMAHHGYRTLAVYPAHGVGSGLEPAGDLGWERVISFDELGYNGPAVGWGRVPDQYTLGWLRDRGLPEDQSRPTLLFAHLVSSHAPWHPPPELAPTWDAWNELEGRDGDRDTALLPPDERPRPTDSDLDTELVARKQRGLAARYLETLRYDLRLLLEHVITLEPARPTVVLITGDHQPAWLAFDRDDAVPMHVLVTERELLGAFMERGFSYGMVPRGEPLIGLDALVPMVARMLTADDLELPERGTSQQRRAELEGR